MKTNELSHDGLGVIMRKNRVVARCEGDGLELAPVFCAASELLEACRLALVELQKINSAEPMIARGCCRAAIAKATAQSS